MRQWEPFESIEICHDLSKCVKTVEKRHRWFWFPRQDLAVGHCYFLRLSRQFSIVCFPTAVKFEDFRRSLQSLLQTLLQTHSIIYILDFSHLYHGCFNPLPVEVNSEPQVEMREMGHVTSLASHLTCLVSGVLGATQQPVCRGWTSTEQVQIRVALQRCGHTACRDCTLTEHLDTITIYNNIIIYSWFVILYICNIISHSYYYVIFILYIYYISNIIKIY